jgi:hypothetical protein
LGGVATAVLTFLFDPPAASNQQSIDRPLTCSTCPTSEEERRKRDDVCKVRYSQSVAWIAKNYLEQNPKVFTQLMFWAHLALEQCRMGIPVTFPGEGPPFSNNGPR